MATQTTVQDMKSLISIDQRAALEASAHLTDKTPESEIFSLGLRFFRYSKIDVALAFFAKVLEKNENNAEAYSNIGSIYHKKGDIESAANFWKYAIKIDPAIDSAYLNLGSYYYNKGDVDQAISYWIILQTLNIKETTVLLNLGAAYDDKNNLLIANHFYEKYLKKASRSVEAQSYDKVFNRITYTKQAAKKSFHVGLKCQKHKEYLQALKAYVRTIEIYPNHLKANLNAGSICYLHNKFEDAIKFWTRGLFIDPYNHKILGNIAIAYDQLELFSYAYVLYKRFLNNCKQEKTFESLKIEDRIKKLDKQLGDKNPYYSSHFSKAEDALKKKDYYTAYFEYKNCHMLKSDSEDLNKKIKSIEEALYPEKIAQKRCLIMGEKAYQKLDIVKAINLLKEGYNLDPKSECAEEIKIYLAKCARILNRAQK